MRRAHPLLLQLLSLHLFLSCAADREPKSQVFVGARQIGTFKGLAAIEAALNQRLLSPPYQGFNLTHFVDGSKALGNLLGAFSGAIGNSAQESATPQAVNTLLWQLVIEGTAEAVTQTICPAAARSQLELRQDFRQNALTLCGDASLLEAPEQELESLWLAVARYDAPESEMRSWIAEETAPEGIATLERGPQRLSQLLQSIMLHPYFLLEH